jgi:hypothetical protein
LLREILPQPGLIAFLVGPQTPATPAMLRQVEAAARVVNRIRLETLKCDLDQTT